MGGITKRASHVTGSHPRAFASTMHTNLQLGTNPPLPSRKRKANGRYIGLLDNVKSCSVLHICKWYVTSLMMGLSCTLRLDAHINLRLESMLYATYRFNFKNPLSSRFASPPSSQHSEIEPKLNRLDVYEEDECGAKLNPFVFKVNLNKFAINLSVEISRIF